MALGARLAWVFRFSDPENTGTGWLGNDAYHHWQIAYLSATVGLHAPGGPRLWDLRGQEYFWGVLHPVLTMLAFGLTGSIDIVVQRLLSIGAGTAAAGLLALVVGRHFGRPAGLASGLLAALLPTSVFNDAGGLLEPFAVALTLLGIWLLDTRPGAAGVALALSTLVRAESWVLAPVVVIFDQRRRGLLHPALVAGFVLVMVASLGFLYVATGNPIYPFYWNFLANGLGAWGFNRAADATAAPLLKPVLGAVLAVAVAALALAHRRRPAAGPFLSYGLGYCAFIALLMGFTAYTTGWHDYFLLSRFFAFPYVFAGALLCTVLLDPADRRPGRTAGGWAAVGMLVLAAQWLWVPIGDGYRETAAAWSTQREAARVVAQAYRAAPAGSTLAIPAAEGPNREVTLSYVLVHDRGLRGPELRSEFYDGFAYLAPGYRYASDPRAGDKAMGCWLSSNHVGTLVLDTTQANEADYVAAHPGWFTRLAVFDPYGWAVYRVSFPGTC